MFHGVHIPPSDHSQREGDRVCKSTTPTHYASKPIAIDGACADGGAEARWRFGFAHYLCMYKMTPNSASRLVN